jgi:predicted aspartyl protease
MIYGKFSSDTNLPYVHIGVTFRGIIVYPSFVLDTGFSGDLKIDWSIAEDLGITETFEVPSVSAHGQRIPVRGVIGHAEMEGRIAPVRILIGEGTPLAGIRLFSVFGYRAVVDCKNKEAYLERVG